MECLLFYTVIKGSIDKWVGANRFAAGGLTLWISAGVFGLWCGGGNTLQQGSIASQPTERVLRGGSVCSNGTLVDPALVSRMASAGDCCVPKCGPGAGALAGSTPACLGAARTVVWPPLCFHLLMVLSCLPIFPYSTTHCKQ